MAFQYFIVGAIMVVAVSVGVQTDHGDSVLMTNLDHVILAVFTLEVIVKIIAEAGHPHTYFKDSWNLFDFCVVMASIVALMMPINGVAMLRLVRLVRVFKLARSLPSLRIIVESLLESLSSVGYIVLMIMGGQYIFSILCMIFFGKNDPEHFGTLPSAMMSVWQCVTLDGWENILYVNMYGCKRYGYYDLYTNPTSAMQCDDTENGSGWYAAIFFVFVVIFGALVMPTVLIGVISISFESSTNRVKSEMKIEGMIDVVLDQCKCWYPNENLRKTATKLRHIFEELDCDAQGSLDVNELRPFMTFYFKHYVRIDVEYDLIESMFYTLDVDDSSDIDFAEFLWFMLAAKHYIPSANKKKKPVDETKSEVADDKPSSNGGLQRIEQSDEDKEDAELLKRQRERFAAEIEADEVALQV